MVPHLLSPFPCCDQRREKFRISTWKRNVSVRSGKRKSRRRRHHHHRRRQSDWSNVHIDVLERVQRKLPFADTLKCRTVCSRWRSVTQKHISSSLNTPSAQQPPLIHSRGFPKLWDSVVPGKDLYQISSKANNFLDPMVSFFVGFYNGWILLLHARKNNCLCLFHPSLFSAEASISLPPILTPKGFPTILTSKDSYWGLNKVVFWGDPFFTNGNYGIAIIHPYYNKLLFAKSGATQFTDLECQDVLEVEITKWKDIICFQKCIFGVSLTDDGQQHHMEGWDCSGEYASPVKVLDFQPEFSSGKGPLKRSTLHLVESQGELLLLVIRRPNARKMFKMLDKRSIAPDKCFVFARSPKTVRVYKMDFSQMQWVQIDSLGDHVLFIMEQQNFSVSSHELPQCKRNTVYFKHYIKYPFDYECCIGVFNMEDCSMEEIWPEEQ